MINEEASSRHFCRCQGLYWEKDEEGLYWEKNEEGLLRTCRGDVPSNRGLAGGPSKSGLPVPIEEVLLAPSDETSSRKVQLRTWGAKTR